MSLATSSVVRADAVADWNAIAIQTIVNGVPAHPGATSFLDIAMVQAALYEAVQAIEGRFKPYHMHITGASGSPEAAAAKAAHDMLVNRFPPLSASLDAAGSVLPVKAARPTPSYLPGPPPSLSPMLAPWLASVTPFTLTSSSQFPTASLRP
jgi:hypothetical protein